MGFTGPPCGWAGKALSGDYADFGGEFDDGANTGFLAIGSVTVPLTPEGVSIIGEGCFGSNDHETEGDRTDLCGAMAGILFDFAEEGWAGPYWFGQ